MAARVLSGLSLGTVPYAGSCSYPARAIQDTPATSMAEKGGRRKSSQPPESRRSCATRERAPRTGAYTKTRESHLARSDQLHEAGSRLNSGEATKCLCGSAAARRCDVAAAGTCLALLTPQCVTGSSRACGSRVPAQPGVRPNVEGSRPSRHAAGRPQRRAACEPLFTHSAAQGIPVLAAHVRPPKGR